jgi:hypothetical protein
LVDNERKIKIAVIMTRAVAIPTAGPNDIPGIRTIISEAKAAYQPITE